MRECEWKDIVKRLKSLEDFDATENIYGYYVDSKPGTFPCRCFIFERNGNIFDLDGGYVMTCLNYSQINEFINLMCTGVTKNV